MDSHVCCKDSRRIQYIYIYISTYIYIYVCNIYSMYIFLTYIYIYIQYMHVIPPFRDAFRICKASKKKMLSLASLKICCQGESSLTDHNLNRGESPRYHQSNDTVPPSFNLKIFSWLETWEISRSVFGVFG